MPLTRSSIWILFSRPWVLDLKGYPFRQTFGSIFVGGVIRWISARFRRRPPRVTYDVHSVLEKSFLRSVLIRFCNHSGFCWRGFWLIPLRPQRSRTFFFLGSSSFSFFLCSLCSLSPRSSEESDSSISHVCRFRHTAGFCVVFFPAYRSPFSVLCFS